MDKCMSEMMIYIMVAYNHSLKRQWLQNRWALASSLANICSTQRVLIQCIQVIMPSVHLTVLWKIFMGGIDNIIKCVLYDKLNSCCAFKWLEYRSWSKKFNCDFCSDIFIGFMFCVAAKFWPCHGGVLTSKLNDSEKLWSFDCTYTRLFHTCDNRLCYACRGEFEVLPCQCTVSRQCMGK